MRNKAVTREQIQDLDRLAIKKYGIPSIVLMENAGRAVAEEILKDRASRALLKKYRNPKVCIFCGLGNNAGDGFVAARYLLNAGLQTKIFLIGRASQLKADAATHYRILKNCGYGISEISSVNRSVQLAVAQADLLVDAIFGVGLNREIGEPYRGIIQALNHSKKRIIAVDVPSGLDATTGKIHGICIKAYKTVTFSLAKTGFFKHDGPLYIGKVVVADIGVPKLKIDYDGN